MKKVEARLGPGRQRLIESRELRGGKVSAQHLLVSDHVETGMSAVLTNAWL